MLRMIWVLVNPPSRITLPDDHYSISRLDPKQDVVTTNIKMCIKQYSSTSVEVTGQAAQYGSVERHMKVCLTLGWEGPAGLIGESAGSHLFFTF